jgi:hypothetical protein
MTPLRRTGQTEKDKRFGISGKLNCMYVGLLRILESITRPDTQIKLCKAVAISMAYVGMKRGSCPQETEVDCRQQKSVS